jgi:hypothetical protein
LCEYKPEDQKATEKSGTEMNSQTFLQPKNKPETTTLLARKQIQGEAAAHLGQAKNPTPHQEWKNTTNRPTNLLLLLQQLETKRQKEGEEGAEEEREKEK